MNEHSPIVSPTAIKVYEALARDIHDMGVKAAFGLISEDTALLITALEANGIRFFGTRHENNAVVMAEGYAATSGSLGVAVIGRGPGAANCLNASIHASRTGTPLIIIMGEAVLPNGAINAMGPDYKASNIEGIFGAAGLTSFKVRSAGTARALLQEAASEASKGQTVTFHLPVDVQLASLGAGANDQRPAPFARRGQSARARESAIQTAAGLLAKAERPLILAGYGAFRSGAKELLARLGDKIGALLITTLRAKDLFRDSPYNLGIAGSFSHSVARRYVNQADCVIVVGASLNFLTSGFGEFLPEAPVIQIDVDHRHIGRYCYADVSLVGDAKLVVDQLLEAVPDRALAKKPFYVAEVRERIAAFHHSHDFKEAHTDWSVDVRSLTLELDRLLPANRNVIMDIGNFFGIMAHYISVSGPGALRYTGEFLSIGLGFGTALGVAAAQVDRPTVLFIGDGSLFMALAELETVAREDLPMIIIVMNDNAYGAERHFLELREQPIAKSVFPGTDFVPIAENFGFEAHTVRSMSDLAKLTELLRTSRGPILIDCKINPAICAPGLIEFARLEGH